MMHPEGQKQPNELGIYDMSGKKYFAAVLGLRLQRD